MTKTNAQAKTVAKTTKVTKAPAKPATKQAAKVDGDKIVSSRATKAGNHGITNVAGDLFTFPTDQWAGEIRKLTAIGQSYAKAVEAIKALPPVKAKAQLARGITAKDAQQSAKAVADQNRGAKATNKADAATQKPKAAKAEKTAADDSRKITFVAPNPKRPGTDSFDRFAKYKKGMTVAQALAAGVLRADIAWDSKREFIKFN